jgi:hypothetical protein
MRLQQIEKFLFIKEAVSQKTKTYLMTLPYHFLPYIRRSANQYTREIPVAGIGGSHL